MSDIFSEVEEDIRRDQMKALWNRFGGYVIGAAVAVVAITVGNVVWQGWQQDRKVEASNSYQAARTLLEAQDPGAQQALQNVIENAPSGYAALARFDLAALHLIKEDEQAALAALDGIAADPGIDGSLRDLARIKAVMIALDISSADEVEARLAPLTREGNAYRPIALEAKALNALRDGREDEARNLFANLVIDTTAPQGVRFRANAMLDVIGRPAPIAVEAIEAEEATEAEGEAAQ